MTARSVGGTNVGPAYMQAYDRVGTDEDFSILKDIIIDRSYTILWSATRVFCIF